MDFNVFFKNNIYIIFGIFIYLLFNSDYHKDYNSKIIVIYSIIITLFLTNTLSIKYMLIIFLLIFFFQFEFFIDDEFKHKILNSFIDKIIDFLYLLIFRFRFILFVVLLLFIKMINFNNINNVFIFYFTSSIFIYIYLVLFINSIFELNSFDYIINKINISLFGKFKPLDDKKIEILTYIEDRTYFERKRTYNFFSYSIIKLKIERIINIIKEIKNKEKNIKYIYKCKSFKDCIIEILNFVRRQIRGYSTLEMQLYRQIAIKDGYNKKCQRKIAELFYSQLIFKNLKNYLKLNYEKVSDKRYKSYLIDRYLEFAPVFLGKYKYDNYYDLFGKKKVSNCDFLFYTLCLSGKLNKDDIITNNKIDIELIKYKYSSYLDKFKITDKELSKTIKFFNKKRV